MSIPNISIYERLDAAAPTPLSFFDILAANTGWQQSPEQWRKASSRYQALASQTKRIALALESLGIRARLESDNVIDLGEVTGEFQTTENYRAIRFLPLIAQRERRPILNALRYFHLHHALGKYLRYAVVTFGVRVPVFGDLRQSIQAGQRAISRWAHEADRDWNVAVLFRGIEFTVNLDRSLHPHANILYAPRQILSKERWSEFLSWTKRRLGGVIWKDCGRLEKPDEAIKYPFKPMELDILKRHDLAWLYHETKRLKLASPLRDFAEFRKELNKLGQKIVMVNHKGGARLCRLRKSSRDNVERNKIDDQVQENLILCRSAPQFRFGPYAQAVIRILNYTTEPKTILGRRRLEQINIYRNESRKFWDENGAPSPEIAIAVARGQANAKSGEASKVRAFNVHTCRLSVQISIRDITTADVPEFALAFSKKIKPPPPNHPSIRCQCCRPLAHH